MGSPITSRVIPSASPSYRSPAQVAREFRRRLDAGARLEPAGSARRNPCRLLTRGYTPKHKIEIFDVTYYLTGPRQNQDIRFFVAYVVLGDAPQRVFPRIFYKDVSLTWRSASHYARSADENWIGKGDVKTVIEDGHEVVVSDESTTDLPLEIQSALESILRDTRRIPHDDDAVAMILRRGPDYRIAPYRDFTGPRQRANANPRNRIHGGRPIVRFTRKNDPTSLRFASGFEPDFRAGIVERSEGKSRLYGGRLRRYRIVSRNRLVQYLFITGPRQVWIASCQATTTEIMSYGVRTIDVPVDEDMLIPAFEYHFLDDDDDPRSLHSQIPIGFAGAVSEVDPSRCDTSPWLDKMPVIREFRRTVLAKER